VRALWTSLFAAAAGAVSIAAAQPPAAGAAPGLVAVAPIDVGIVDGAETLGTLSATLVLDSDPAGDEAIVAVEPRLRAALRTAMSEFARLHASPYEAVDATMLARDLTDAARAAAPAVKRVLIVEVAARTA
jgi:hypothetical protein